MSRRQDSNPLYDGIRSLVLSARQSAARGVDLLQVYTNYEIGRRIVEQEQQGADRAQYGKELVRELATRLTGEFGSGFSKTNLEYMRRFYLAYPGRNPQIAQTVSGQSEHDAKSKMLSRKLPAPQKKQLSSVNFTLSWSQYVFLMGIKNPEERSFYEIEAVTQGWAVR